MTMSMEVLYTVPPPFRGLVLAVFPSPTGWTALTDRGWIVRSDGGTTTEPEPLWQGTVIRSWALSGDRLLLGGDPSTRLYGWPDLTLVAEYSTLRGPVATGDGQLVAAGLGVVAGLGRDGEQRWTVSFKASVFDVAVGNGWVYGAYADRGLKAWPLQPNGTPKARGVGRQDGIPVTLAVGAGALWVGHSQLGRLDRLAADGGSVVGSVQVGRAQQISFAEVGGRGYVVGSGQRRVWVVDADTLSEVASVSVSPLTEEAVFPVLAANGTLWFGCDRAVVRVPGAVSVA